MSIIDTEKFLIEKAKRAKTLVASLSQIDKRNTSRRGKYKKSWAVKNEAGKLIVYNKEYRLVHLLSEGHKFKDGSRYAGNQHMSKTLEAITGITDAESKLIIKQADDEVRKLISKYGFK